MHTEQQPTHCAACRRPLTDSDSVNRGLGPICVQKYLEQPEAKIVPRVETLVRELAINQSGHFIVEAIDELRQWGFAELADKIERRALVATIEEDGDDAYFVATEYSDAQVERFRQIPGRRFVKDESRCGWLIPKRSRHALWSALQSLWPGRLVAGPRGPFVI